MPEETGEVTRWRASLPHGVLFLASFFATLMYCLHPQKQPGNDPEWKAPNPAPPAVSQFKQRPAASSGTAKLVVQPAPSASQVNQDERLLPARAGEAERQAHVEDIAAFRAAMDDPDPEVARIARDAYGYYTGGN